MILFIMGIMLSMGVVNETGFFASVSEWIDYNIHNVWALGVMSGLLSGVVDTFTVAMTNLSLYDVVDDATLLRWVDSDYMANFVQNGTYWKIVAFSTSVGGCLTCFASQSGIALMKMERMHVGWYFKNCTPKVLLGWMAGMALLWVECYLLK